MKASDMKIDEFAERFSRRYALKKRVNAIICYELVDSIVECLEEQQPYIVVYNRYNQRTVILSSAFLLSSDTSEDTSMLPFESMFKTLGLQSSA